MAGIGGWKLLLPEEGRHLQVARSEPNAISLLSNQVLTDMVRVQVQT